MTMDDETLYKGYDFIFTIAASAGYTHIYNDQLVT